MVGLSGVLKIESREDAPTLIQKMYPPYFEHGTVKRSAAYVVIRNSMAVFATPGAARVPFRIHVSSGCV